MVKATTNLCARPQDTRSTQKFIYHASFEEADAITRYDWEEVTDKEVESSTSHMADEVTRDAARRMHFAAFRLNRAESEDELEYWKDRYNGWRDRVILGNRKLVFRAVQKWTFDSQAAEDLISECYIVLIRAVAAYNPWLGIRFSTYAFTCLLRALSRLGRRLAADRLSKALSLQEPEDHSSLERLADAEPNNRLRQVDEYLRDEHPLLSAREKMVVRRRFNLMPQQNTPTLANVGRDLGLSKERVRQLQSNALVKLRQAMVESNNLS